MSKKLWALTGLNYPKSKRAYKAILDGGGRPAILAKLRAEEPEYPDDATEEERDELHEAHFNVLRKQFIDSHYQRVEAGKRCDDIPDQKLDVEVADEKSGEMKKRRMTLTDYWLLTEKITDKDPATESEEE